MKHLLFIIFFGVFFGVFGQKPLIIAHRGASAYAPENTLEAFKKAIEMGADYIETDVHQTKDSVVVIMHDFSVNRTCEIPDSSGIKSSKKILIKDLYLAQFSSLRIKEKSYPPPTLDSAIKFINGRCRLLIEIKKGSDYYPEIEKHILDIIYKNHAENWVNIIHSFDKNALLEINRQNTGITLQKLIVFKLPLASMTYSKNFNKDRFDSWQGVNVYYRFTSKKLIHRLHQQHKTVFSWTVNRSKAAKRLIKRGVDGIITNKPDMIKEIVANK